MFLENLEKVGHLNIIKYNRLSDNYLKFMNWTSVHVLPWNFSGMNGMLAILRLVGLATLQCGVYGGSIRCPAPG